MKSTDLPLDELLHPQAWTRVLGAGSLWGCIVLGARRHGDRPSDADWHRSRLYSANFILAGGGVFTDSRGTRHRLAPGALYQRTGPGPTGARVEISAGTVECFFLLDDATFGGLHALQIIPAQETLSCGAPILLAKEFLEFRALCRRPPQDVGRRQIVAGLAAWLATLYDRALQTRGDGFWDRVVAAAAKRLGSDLSARLHPPDLARELHVSYPSFRRAFVRAKGVPPGEYRIRRRIEAACCLLGQHPVNTVAERLGYPDPFTFSAQFRKFTGTPPSTFRQNIGRGGP